MEQPYEALDESEEDEGGIDRRTVIALALFVGCFSVAVGLGYLVNPGIGWLFAGIQLIAVVVAVSLAHESVGDGQGR